jgi:chorismate-pyruvate lyase
MTVTLETFYGSPVSVHVLESLETDGLYARKILLSTASDGRIVLFGIVRLFPQHLDPEVFESIRQQQIPLGRILIGKKVLRSVRLENLFRVTLTDATQAQLPFHGQKELFGRTARIQVAGEPAIDLLEIVPPLPTGIASHQISS